MVDDASDWRSYYSALAFVDGALDMGCPSGCTGYELTRNLDFDTSGSGSPDAGDDYWNGGEGWVPIGGDGTTAAGTMLFLRNPFTATFEGNGHTVSNLFIDADTVVLVGLFGYASSSIRNVGMTDVDVKGADLAGGLIGFNFGEIRASYVTGRVSGKENVGGLVGINHSNGEILASYATSRVSGEDDMGGLVGDNRGKITAAYATGHVSGEKEAGGLVGFNQSTGEIHGSYATSRVTGDSDVGGLVGLNEGAVTVSYWDTSTSGHTTGSSGEGKTTVELQTPTGSSGIYQSWDADLWHFGTASQYPTLKANVDGQGQATWQEFGYQLREGPTLTAMPSPTQIVLSWTQVRTNHWTQAPSVAYTLTPRRRRHLEDSRREPQQFALHRYRRDHRYHLHVPGCGCSYRRRSDPQRRGRGGGSLHAAPPATTTASSASTTVPSSSPTPAEQQFPDGGCGPGPDRRQGRRPGDPGRQRQQRSGRRSATISLESNSVARA